MRRVSAALTAAALSVAAFAGAAGSASAAAPGQRASAAATEQCAYEYYKAVTDKQTGRLYYLLVPIDFYQNPECLLQPGDRDRPNIYPTTAVHGLQRNLNTCYGEHLTVDGIYGSATKAAVARAQSKAGISADGVYGPRSAQFLKSRLYSDDRASAFLRCYRLYDLNY